MINILNISKFFSKNYVLDNVSFKIEEGKATCLLGKNGAGKTTIVNIISGLLKQNKGHLYIDNEKISQNSYNYRKKFGYVFEEHMLIDKLSAKEYITLIAEMYDIPKNEYVKRIKSLLDFFELPYDNSKYIESYSLGMKVKTSLAAAIVHKPKYLILDEPFNGLDIVSVNNLIALLKNFIMQKGTIFITSHNLDLVADLCDTFLIIENGKISLELNKSDYDSIESLKNKVKEVLIKEDSVNNISWLNS
jgi:ABC-2 type transport system ATP-binding protein